MSTGWNRIVETLRTEVAEYGRLFQLFEEQQTLLFRRDAQGVLATSGPLDEQVHLLEGCRREREEATATFASDQGRPRTATLRSLLPLMPAEVQPLLLALITETNRMVSRVRRISRHNRLFLQRTVENHQELVRHFRPGAFSRTYAPNGRVALAATGSRSALAVEG